MHRVIFAVALLATPAHAADYPPGLFEHSPEINSSEPELTCDFQKQCYHMDLADPDRVTPPPAPQYPAPPVAQDAPAPLPPPVVQALPEPLSEDPDDMGSCFNLRRGLFPTPEAAAHAHARCH